MEDKDIILKYIHFLLKQIYKSNDCDIIMSIIDHIDNTINLQLSIEEVEKDEY